MNVARDRQAQMVTRVLSYLGSTYTYRHQIEERGEYNPITGKYEGSGTTAEDHDVTGKYVSITTEDRGRFTIEASDMIFIMSADARKPELSDWIDDKVIVDYQTMTRSGCPMYYRIQLR